MDAEMQELIDNLHKTCTAETGATDGKWEKVLWWGLIRILDQIAEAKKGNFADDDNFKCYFKCIFDQMGCVSGREVLRF